MIKRKKILAVLMMAALIINIFSISVFAVSVDTNNYHDEESVVLPINDGSEELRLPESENNTYNLSDGKLIADLSKSAYKSRSANSVTEQFVDVLDDEYNFKYVTFDLYQNDVTQITLKCPDNANIDYDLQLYKVDSEGNISGPVVHSPLVTRINSNGHTLDESVGYIHSEQEKQEYAIFVVSKDGNTTTEPFTLTISFDFASNLDWTEINDSPYFAQSIDMSGALEIVDTTLNVVNDQDWFLWENNSDFTKLSTSVTQGHKVEVYHAENGSQMVLNNYTESNGVREFDIYDMNYIRVFSDKNEADLSYNKYILSLSPAGGTPVGVSSNMDVTLNGDQGKNSYVTYSSLSKTSRFRYNDILNPEVKVTDVNGNPVAGVTVTMTLVSSFWPESSKNHIQTFTGKTNSKGEVTITARPAETLGTYKVYLTDAIDFLHHVDIDNITFSVDDGGTASFSTQVYRLAYSEYMGS